MAKQDKFIVYTPVAELGFGSLRTPDTKFDAEGVYKQDFFLTPDQAKQFCERIESDPRAIVKGKKARVKFTKVDGNIKFRAKQKAVIRNKQGEQFEMKPKLLHVVDGKTVEYPADAPTPWSGSTGEIEVEVIPYEGFGGGLTFRLRAIRLHQIVGGTTGAASGGWSEVEEGYTSVAKDKPTGSADEPEYEEEGADDGDEEEERW